MDLKPYLNMVAEKIEVAAAKGDKGEVIRLAHVAKDALDDVIRQAQRGKESERWTG